MTMPAMPPPELITRVCTAGAHAALHETREAGWYDLLAAILLIKAGTELMAADGKSPDEIAAWLRKQAQAIEESPGMMGPIGGRA